MAHRNLSFRRLEDERTKNFEDACSRPAWPTWKISVFRTIKKFEIGSAHHTCHPMTVECRTGRKVRSQIRDWPRLTQCYPLAINNIKTERNKKAEPGRACASFSSTYTEIGTFWDISLNMLDRNYFNYQSSVHACVYIVYTCTFRVYYILVYSHYMSSLYVPLHT